MILHVGMHVRPYYGRYKGQVLEVLKMFPGPTRLLCCQLVDRPKENPVIIPSSDVRLPRDKK